MHNQETLPLLLKQLNLSCMYAQWEAIATQAEEEKWEYAKYLTALANYELAGRQQKRITRYIKESGLYRLVRRLMLWILLTINLLMLRKLLHWQITLNG